MTNALTKRGNLEVDIHGERDVNMKAATISQAEKPEIDPSLPVLSRNQPY